MTVEIRVQSVKPLRQTFGHIARRFGDKPATRYQEGTYDLQSEVNFHYKPLWDPAHDIYDKRRTAVVMADWYALKDPRQYYYGAWTIARARQQEAADRQLELAQQRDWLRQMAPEGQQQLVQALLPLRHYEWGANTNLCAVAAYGYGTALTQAAAMATMDRLGLAQHLSRLGLLMDGNTGTSLAQAKQQWLEAGAWQGARAAMEAMFVTRDPMELLLAQALVADTLVYALCLRGFEGVWSGPAATGLTMLLDHPLRWHEETSRWVDGVMKTVATESDANRALLQGWAAQWRATWRQALAPLAARVLGDAAGATALDLADAALATRLARLGLGAAPAQNRADTATATNAANAT
ncbi:phenol hydroxylase [Ideonella livida]|uniref:Phenol hydroxylase n=1 Tax=Ideonella livida TaxID=2707176 RepID=A0A7C9TM97_9BURK|nr:phenol hydroxylase [Ideonella livida]NDY93758.1 phenol hydroxylase [Ideonella livida]